MAMALTLTPTLVEVAGENGLLDSDSDGASSDGGGCCCHGLLALLVLLLATTMAGEREGERGGGPEVGFGIIERAAAAP
ncbi:hypothetical protein F4825DRAFT_455162 [Nemania diffusa]|nr:hypothetical protein F4825DRAFT_455162 [Nemania diffusa]